VVLSASQAAEVKQLLQQPASYSFNSGKACLPNYDVLLVFHNRPHDVEVALCFSCRMLGVFAGPTARRLNSEEDFDPIHPQLVALARALFPNVPHIQQLK
jgi:hypothetical protein